MTVLGWPLDHAHYPYIFLNATYLHRRLGQNMQVVSRAVVVAIVINPLGYREVLGIAVGDSVAEASGAISSAPYSRRLLRGSRSVV